MNFIWDYKLYKVKLDNDKNYNDTKLILFYFQSGYVLF